MLFNSYEFIFLFLPVTISIYYLLARIEIKGASHCWLVAMSLFFYSWWNIKYLALILGSIIFNYLIANLINYRFARKAKIWLLIGIIGNLALLGFYKYFNFFIENINFLLNKNFVLETIILPLGISFYTFQQIAYLVDSFQGKTMQYGPLKYFLFVTFFPQLIAGPIIHHADILPQFSKSRSRMNWDYLAIGTTIFVLGLSKKVILADNIAPFATAVFTAAESSTMLSLPEAWAGAFAYTFQLYFDFSGYCDMAIGLGYMFGIHLPDNFNSPYKATSISDFWKRWHITLSNFLRDYIYIPLGGNRKGNLSRSYNLMVTMLLGGLWHGAGWTFVLWGGIHGFYLVINHTWKQSKFSQLLSLGKWPARVITFLAVVLGWVLFRAETLSGALNLYQSMFNLKRFWSLFQSSSATLEPSFNLSSASQIINLGDSLFPTPMQVSWRLGLPLILLLFSISWWSPNTSEIISQHKLKLVDTQDSTSALETSYSDKYHIGSFNYYGATLIAGLFIISLCSMTAVSEFLYFNF